MNDRTRILAAVGLTVLLFLGVQVGALALIEPFDASDRQAVDDPDNPTNSIVYFGIILVATAFMLAAFRYNVQWLVRAMIIGVSVMLAWFVFTEFVPPAVTVAEVNVLAALAAIGIGAALLWYPEWYVIDLTGVLMGAGAAALFGISFGLLPAILLLSVLAVYDAISVYGTEHMLDLAEGVMDLKIPVVFVIPTTLSYSYLDAGSTDDVLEDGGTAVGDTETESEQAAAADTKQAAGEDAEQAAVSEQATASTTEQEETSDGLDRDVFFVGLGDAVIPTILVASAAVFIDAGTIDVPGVTLNLAALGAIGGTLVGLLILMYMVLKGRPHAGLPLLNGGAIGGYLLGALASGLSIVAALGL